MAKRSASAPLPVIGWREWVALPALGVAAIKVKVDTGARSSSLHAFDVHTFQRRGETYVRFTIHPLQRDVKETIVVEARLLEHRHVRSSGGHQTLRPVIRTMVELCGRRWPIELTLASRDAMGFRMLLGRQAMRGRFLVDPGRSFCDGEHLPDTGPRRRRSTRRRS